MSDDKRPAAPPRRVIGTPSPAESRQLLPEQVERRAELPAELVVDERTSRRGERLVALFFTLSLIGSLAFIAAYVIFEVGSLDRTLRSNLGLGLSMAVAFLGLAAGATIWVRKVMPHPEYVEERKPLRSPEPEREAFAATFSEGAAASGFLRSKLLRRTLIAAALPLGLAPLVLLRDLGPLPRRRLYGTAWRAGTRLVIEGSNQPVRVQDFTSVGGIITVIPEGTEHDLDELAKSTVLLIKMEPQQLELPDDRKNWTVDGIIAYSKICTHVGCPAALYEQTTRHILCPCHQSTFDAARGAKVIFGPAARPLPQLPITVDSEGFLVAQSGFKEPVGPSFWERGSYQERG